MGVVDTKDKTGAALFLAAEFLSRALGPLVFILLFRYTEIAKLGFFSFASSLALITVTIVSFGMNYYISNDLARDAHHRAEGLGRIFAIKIPLSIVYVALSLLYAVYFSGREPNYGILFLVLLFWLNGNIVFTIVSVFILHKQAMISQMVRLTYFWISFPINCMIILIWKKFEIWLLVSVFLDILYTLIFLIIMVRKCRIPVLFQWHYIFSFKLLYYCLPYFCIGMLAFLYNYMDSIVLYRLAAPEYVAYYRTIFSFYVMTNVIPMTFVNIFMPRLSESFIRGREFFSDMLGQVIRYVLFLDAVAIFTVLFFPEVIYLLFGNKLLAFPEPGAGVAVQLIIAALLPYSFSSILGTALIVGGHRRTVMLINLSAVLMQGALLFHLIPLFSLFGCIYSRLFVETVLAAITAIVLFKFFGLEIRGRIVASYFGFFVCMLIAFGVARTHAFAFRILVLLLSFASFGMLFKIFSIRDVQRLVILVKGFRNRSVPLKEETLV